MIPRDPIAHGRHPNHRDELPGHRVTTHATGAHPPRHSIAASRPRPITIPSEDHTMTFTVPPRPGIRGLLCATVAATFAGAVQAEGVLRSAGPLEFGPGGVLFVGDGVGAQVVAFEMASVLDDQSGYELGRIETFEGRTLVPDLPAALGALVGAPAEQVVVNDMAVHSATRQVVISGHRGLGPDARPFLAKVDRGEAALIDHAALPSTAHALGGPPAEATLEFGQPTAAYAVTDIDHHGGEIFVAGVSGEEFASTLRRVPYL